MANNTSNSTYHHKSNGTQFPLSTSKCIPWFAGFTTECLAIIILNIIIIIFVKQRQLQSKSTYSIIHPSIVDLLVGAVSGPLSIALMGSLCNLWNNDRMIASRQVPLIATLVNLTAISLERVHAAFRPFKRRFIKKWVYGVIINVIWLITASTLLARAKLINNIRAGIMMYFSIFAFLLFVISLPYIFIFIKVLFSRHPNIMAQWVLGKEN